MLKPLAHCQAVELRIVIEVVSAQHMVAQDVVRHRKRRQLLKFVGLRWNRLRCFSPEACNYGVW